MTDDNTVEYFAQPKIVGYRQLDPDCVAVINEIKVTANATGELVDRLAEDSRVDARWVHIARTQLQQGFMALTRAVAKPTSF